eukprot:3469872-Amphidinium_carterae.1
MDSIGGHSISKSAMSVECDVKADMHSEIQVLRKELSTKAISPTVEHQKKSKLQHMRVTSMRSTTW